MLGTLPTLASATSRARTSSPRVSARTAGPGAGDHEGTFLQCFDVVRQIRLDDYQLASRQFDFAARQAKTESPRQHLDDGGPGYLMFSECGTILQDRQHDAEVRLLHIRLGIAVPLRSGSFPSQSRGFAEEVEDGDRFAQFVGWALIAPARLT
jgi:hypothetical protein